MQKRLLPKRIPRNQRRYYLPIFRALNLSLLNYIKQIPRIPFIHYPLSILKFVCIQRINQALLLLLSQILKQGHIVYKIEILLIIALIKRFNRSSKSHAVNPP